VLRGKTDRLTRAEKAALQPFAAARSTADPDDAADDSTSFVERLHKRRRLAEAEVEYEQVSSVPPTSNAVERFFSVARVTFGQQRHGLLPLTLETLLFLKENRSFWDASTVISLG
jgi:hypothetical protein